MARVSVGVASQPELALETFPSSMTAEFRGGEPGCEDVALLVIYLLSRYVVDADKDMKVNGEISKSYPNPYLPQTYRISPEAVALHTYSRVEYA